MTMAHTIAASPEQTRLIDNLLRERDVPFSWVMRVDQLREAGMGKSKASQVIDSLRNMPYKRTERAESTPAPTVESGVYALGGTADPVRYKVRNVTEGRWAGRTFLDVLLANGEREPVRNRRQVAEILTAIAADIEAARKLYADTTGKCWSCNRLLTDPVSVSVGLGPDCRKNLGR
jgi:hypothetical protein